MAFTVPVEIVDKLGHSDFDRIKRDMATYGADYRRRVNETGVQIDPNLLSKGGLDELHEAAAEAKSRTLLRSLKVFLAARSGDFTHTVPRGAEFPQLAMAYLKSDMIDGWIYVQGSDELLRPELVTDITLTYNQQDRTVTGSSIRTIATSLDSDKGVVRLVTKSHTFTLEETVRRTVPAILESQGIFKESPEFKAEYLATSKRHVEAIIPSFAKQFRFTGTVLSDADQRYGSKSVTGRPLSNRKVIYDLETKQVSAVVAYADSKLADGSDDDKGALVPFHSVMKVFDLKSHKFYWIDSRNVEPYTYDKSLREKLVLPTTHSDLLDVMTNSMSAFKGDIIEGKSAGNVILCTGVPGVGKTLTAEVYAELLDKALYSIHSGNLGTSAADIQKNLEIIFDRSRRWDCVLLLDEADVFVVERGNNIEQNAIVAEFLRTLEYFDGLLFMTTNRHQTIDDAILSRCIAIVNFNPPGRADALRIWNIITTQFGRQISVELAGELADLFPQAAGRDIKMLASATFRMIEGAGWPLDIDSFRKCAMFRGVDMREIAGGDTTGMRKGRDLSPAEMLAAVSKALKEELGTVPYDEAALQKVLAKAK